MLSLKRRRPFLLLAVICFAGFIYFYISSRDGDLFDPNLSAGLEHGVVLPRPVSTGEPISDSQLLFNQKDSQHSQKDVVPLSDIEKHNYSVFGMTGFRVVSPFYISQHQIERLLERNARMARVLHSEAILMSPKITEGSEVKSDNSKEASFKTQNKNESSQVEAEKQRDNDLMSCQCGRISDPCVCCVILKPVLRNNSAIPFKDHLPIVLAPSNKYASNLAKFCFRLNYLLKTQRLNISSQLVTVDANNPLLLPEAIHQVEEQRNEANAKMRAKSVGLTSGAHLRNLLETSESMRLYEEVALDAKRASLVCVSNRRSVDFPQLPLNSERAENDNNIQSSPPMVEICLKISQITYKVNALGGGVHAQTPLTRVVGKAELVLLLQEKYILYVYPETRFEMRQGAAADEDRIDSLKKTKTVSQADVPMRGQLNVLRQHSELRRTLSARDAAPFATSPPSKDTAEKAIGVKLSNMPSQSLASAAIPKLRPNDSPIFTDELKQAQLADVSASTDNDSSPKTRLDKSHKRVLQPNANGREFFAQFEHTGADSNSNQIVPSNTPKNAVNSAFNEQAQRQVLLFSDKKDIEDSTMLASEE